MSITFESLPRDDGTHSVRVTIGDETTSVAIGASEWEKLQECAKLLVRFVHPANHDENEERKKASENAVRDAYLAFALRHPQYRMSDEAVKHGIHAPGGMVFHTEMFTSGQRGNFFHPIMQMSMRALGATRQENDGPLDAQALLEEMERVTTPKPTVSDVRPVEKTTPYAGRG